MRKLFIIVATLCSTIASQGSGTEEDDSDSVYGLWFQSKVAVKARNYLDKIESVSTNTIRMGRQGLNSSNSFHPDDYDPLFLEYGVSTEVLDQPLLVGKDKELHYRVLVNTPHGRHLLMVSLLEQLGATSWTSRCGGKLSIFLPDSLRNPNQPPPPPGACMLDNIVVQGEVVDREGVKEKFDEIIPSEKDFEIFSWFDEVHRQAIHELAEWIIEVESFGSAYSLLVVMKEWLTKQMFVELVNCVIVGRHDTGFTLPSMETYMPEDFFQEDIIAFCNDNTEDDIDKRPEVDEFWDTDRSHNGASQDIGVLGSEESIEVFGDSGQNESETGREGRQWIWTNGGWRWRWRTTQPQRTTSTRSLTTRPTTRSTTLRTTRPSTRRTTARPRPWGTNGMTWTRNSPRQAEWYYREDPVVNAHHTEWHRGGAGSWRRGESFYFMHSQMLARYEAERLSLGMRLTRNFMPSQWDRLVGDSYNPRLGGRWAMRRQGYIRTDAMHRMRGQVDNEMRAFARYSRGEDTGIDRFGASLERTLHNRGHVEISSLSGGRGGVMGSTVASMRDPIFYRWHGYIERKFRDYKSIVASSNPYTDRELSFPGVRVVSSHVVPERGDQDIFYTYRDMASVRLNSLDQSGPGNRMTVQYRRLNHIPFRWNIVIQSELPRPTPAIVRIFMMPTGEGAQNRVRVQNRATIHMDHFLVELNPGINQLSRDELEAPHLSKSRWSLNELQDRLMNGQLGQTDFSWGGCGWPRHLNVPRGTEEGMPWTLVVMVSRVLDQDIRRLDDWRRNNHLAWSYCGVRGGLVPDSRPMGFPVDRDFEDINMLAGGRGNWNIKQVTIRHIPHYVRDGPLE